MSTDLPVRNVEYSPRWDDATTPRIAAVVSTYRRSEFLPGLIDALTQQSLPRSDFELIVVDNGSTDATWKILTHMVSQSDVRMAVTTLDANRGPGGGRNHGIALVRAPYLAITDDDCLPTPTWLAEMLAALESGAAVVQGQVNADPDDRDSSGPWAHTKWITEPTPFFETCNVGYRTDALRGVGGFDEKDALTAQTGGGRAFGEDALLAWRVQESGGTAAFTTRSLVYHRNIPADFRDWLHGQRNLVGFPGLGNRSPLVSKWFWHRYFLARETALFDLALSCLLAAAVLRRPWLLIGLLPWARQRWPDALHRANNNRKLALVRMGQLAVADSVSLASLAEGSVRHRRVLL